MTHPLIRTCQAIGLEWKTIGIEDFRRLAPALAAHEAEWISAGKLRECLARWLEGADFSDPAQREWEGSVPEKTAKEELVGLLREAEPAIRSRIYPSDTVLPDLCERIRERLKREDL